MMGQVLSSLAHHASMDCVSCCWSGWLDPLGGTEKNKRTPRRQGDTVGGNIVVGGDGGSSCQSQDGCPDREHGDGVRGYMSNADKMSIYWEVVYGFVYKGQLMCR